MNPVEKLIAASRKERKRIAVAGDSMRDEWIVGEVDSCQEMCQRFHIRREVATPGGAANAARQLARWDVDVTLLAVLGLRGPRLYADVGAEPNVSIEHCSRIGTMPVKRRYLVGNHVVFRTDEEPRDYQLDAMSLEIIRSRIVELVKTQPWDAVLISDYDKGMLDEKTIRQIIDTCNERRIPVVADAKREPSFYSGATLKGNADYAARWMIALGGYSPMAVLTMGAELPVLMGEQFDGIQIDLSPKPAPVHCRNHVGAGDCFSAHLTLCLAHGIPLPEAIKIAHAAGRVYVQHEHGRPPWSHEIRRDLDPVGGKILAGFHLPALRQSIAGRIVLTNGVFRLGAHAGHACLMQWARHQGDCLIVAVNDDESAAVLRHGQAVLPFAERATTLAAMSAVDWVVPFNGDVNALAKQLQPDVLVKGFDYKDAFIPGSDKVKDVRVCPESPFPRHTSGR